MTTPSTASPAAALTPEVASAPPTTPDELLRRYQAGERDFKEAKLAGYEIKSATLHVSDFSRAQFDNAELNGTGLAGAIFSGATFIQTDLTGADLNLASLAGATLDHAICRGTVFRDADFTGATLKETNLEGADLRGAVGLRLDSTLTRNANFGSGRSQSRARRDRQKLLSGYATEALQRAVVRPRSFAARVMAVLYPVPVWFHLRRKYTGARFIMNLYLLTVFLIPLIARGAYWGGVNSAQHALATTTDSVARTADALAQSGSLPRELAATLLARAGAVTPCLARECREVPMWKLVLGLDTGWALAVITAAVFLFNLARAFVTLQVAPMRDEEGYSGYSPAWEDYKGLIPWDLAVRTLFWVSISWFGYHLVTWARLSVYLPR